MFNLNSFLKKYLPGRVLKKFQESCTYLKLKYLQNLQNLTAHVSAAVVLQLPAKVCKVNFLLAFKPGMLLF